MQSYKDYRSSVNDTITPVVDLSAHINKLIEYEDISDDLTDEQETKIIDYVKALLRISHDKISRRYDYWRDADRAHDVYVPADATEFREKAVIADTRAIADTVLTYQMAALSGRNPMFQLEGLNRNSRTASAILERVLHQQMRNTAGEARLAQLLLDSIRYGFAPTKVIWNPKRNQNEIVNFDPRRCFPDPRVQWGDWDNMQFIVFVDYASTQSLMATGLYPKLKKYPRLRANRANAISSWPAHRFNKEEGKSFNIDPSDPLNTDATQNNFTVGAARVTDEAWVRLSGHEIGVPSIDQIWLTISILDESAVIRFQLNPYGQQFPVVIGGMYHDRHKTFSQSLYDLLMPLHEISTWMLRSRIDNVQSALNNLIFVDPTRVNVADLIERNPWGLVRSLPGTNPGEGIYIAQIPDITRGHWSDIAAMGDLKQRVSAASDAQQGVPTSDGIRSATEIQRLTQLGSQRLGVLSRIASAQTIRPLVRMMVSNLQDALNVEGSIRAPKNQTPGLLSPLVDNGYIDYDAQMLQGQVDYLVVDGTLPIEPSRNAETWMTMLQVLNMTGLNMEYKSDKIVEEAIRAMGVSDLEQYKYTDEEKQQGPTPAQQLSIMEKMRGANVQPQDQVMAEAQKGNIIPMSQAMGQ